MKKKIFIGIVVIIAISITCFIIDYLRIKDHKKPICSFKYNDFSDGRSWEGSSTYFGLGYKINAYFELNDSNVANINNPPLDGTYHYEIGTWFKSIDTNRVVESLIEKDKAMEKMKE